MVVVLEAAHFRRSIRFRARSYLALVLLPQLPIAEWVSELDHWIGSSAVEQPVVLDLSGVALSATDIAHLVSELSERNIRVMGLEGVELSQPLPGLPPVLRGGRERDKALLAQPQSRESRNEPDGPELTPRFGRTVADVERELILETLRHCGGNRTRAANILGISIRTLRNKLNEYAGRQPRPGAAVDHSHRLIHVPGMSAGPPTPDV